MRVNLHMKADALARKVRTQKFSGNEGEGLIFQFLPSEEMEVVEMAAAQDAAGTRAAIDQLYADALEIYERARREVTIPRKDGREQAYAPVRYKRQIDRGYEDGVLVPTVARIVRKRTLGFGHLENAERPDLMLETLVIDSSKPYHHLFTPETIHISQRRRDEYDQLHGNG